MTFDAFWQTHRRFITGVTIGFVVFLILRAVMSGGWEGEGMGRSGKEREIYFSFVLYLFVYVWVMKAAAR